MKFSSVTSCSAFIASFKLAEIFSSKLDPKCLAAAYVGTPYALRQITESSYAKDKASQLQEKVNELQEENSVDETTRKAKKVAVM